MKALAGRNRGSKGKRFGEGILPGPPGVSQTHLLHLHKQPYPVVFPWHFLKHTLPSSTSNAQNAHLLYILPILQARGHRSPPLQSLFWYLKKKLGHLFLCDSTEPHAPLDTHPHYLMLMAPSLGQLPHARKGKAFWKVSMSSFPMLFERCGPRRWPSTYFQSSRVSKEETKLNWHRELKIWRSLSVFGTRQKPLLNRFRTHSARGAFITGWCGGDSWLCSLHWNLISTLNKSHYQWGFWQSQGH